MAVPSFWYILSDWAEQLVAYPVKKLINRQSIRHRES
jgi:hypothetical protein